MEGARSAADCGLVIAMISKRIFPLAQAVARVQRQLEAIARIGSVPLMTFT